MHWLYGLIFLFINHFGGYAQNPRNITISPPVFQTDKIVIPFKIPNSGMVEFYLYDDVTNQGILRTQLICQEGDSVITFSRKKLEEGMPYRYDIVYKGQKVSGKLRP